jgi:hypothetical protein
LLESLGSGFAGHADLRWCFACMARTWNRRFMGVVSRFLRLMPMGIILKGLIN